MKPEKTNTQGVPSGRPIFKIAWPLAALALACCWAFAAEEWSDPRTVGGSLKVEWVGRLVRGRTIPAEPYPAGMIVMRTDGTRATHTTAYTAALPDDTIDIGLRSDGVLVWRKARD